MKVSCVEEKVWRVVVDVKGNGYSGKDVYKIIHVHKDVWLVAGYVVYESSANGQSIRLETGFFAKLHNAKSLRKFLKEIGVPEDSIKEIFRFGRGRG